MTGGGILRAVAPSVHVRNVALEQVKVTRRIPATPYHPPDAAIHLEPPTAASIHDPGTLPWLLAVNAGLTSAPPSDVAITNVALTNVRGRYITSVIAASGFATALVQKVTAKGV